MGPRGAARAAAIAVLLLAGPASARAQDPVRGYEEGFFDLFLYQAGRRVGVNTLVDSAGRVLVPLRAVAEHAGILMTWTPDSVVLEWPPDTWRTLLRLDDRAIVTELGTTTVAPTEWILGGADLFLSTAVLGRILGSPVEIAFADLTIVLTPHPDFPILRRFDVAHRRRIAPSAPVTAETVDVPYPARTGGLAGSWGISANQGAGTHAGALRAAVGGSVWGGGMESGGTLTFGNAVATELQDRFVRWVRGFPEHPWLRQLQVGTVFSDGPAGQRINGVAATNAPFTTPRFFDDAVIEPALPAGWEYEVYQGEYLVGVGTRDAPVRTAVNYGNTPVRIRMLGPSGQEIQQQIVYVIRPDMVPQGEWRWFAGAGACADEGCDDYAYADLRRGISSRLTAGVGLDRITPLRGSSRIRPSVALIGNPLNNVSADLQFQPGSLFRTGLQIHSPEAGSVAAQYAWIEPPGDAPVLGGWNAQLTGSARVPGLGGRFVNGRLLARGARNGHVDLWQGAIATTIDRLYTTLEYESGLQARDLLTTRVFASWPAPGLGPIRDLAVSAAVGVSSIGAEMLEFGTSVRPTPTITAAASLRMRKDARPTFVLGLTTRLGAAYTQVRASSTGQTRSVYLSADGGFAHDPALGLLPLAFESLGRAGIGGAVFEDLNGDGVRNADEPPVPGATIAVGTERVRSGDDGTYRTWLIRPYEVETVALDSLSVPFHLVPLRRAVLVRPSPNLFTRIDIALVRTREVTGSIEGGEAFEDLAGIGIEILDGDRRVAADTRTFRDGDFYVPRLRPGRYALRVAGSSLAALGASTSPAELAFDVPAEGDLPIELPPLRLVRLR